MNFDDLELANQRVCPLHRHGKQLEMTPFSHHILCLSFSSQQKETLCVLGRFACAIWNGSIQVGKANCTYHGAKVLEGHTLDPVDNVELPRACLWTLGGSHSTQKEPTKKDLGYGSNPRNLLAKGNHLLLIWSLDLLELSAF